MDVGNMLRRMLVHNTQSEHVLELPRHYFACCVW